MLFVGGKKISELMKGVGKGVKSLKEGLNETKDIDRTRQMAQSGETMTFWEHLDALRSVIVRVVLVTVVAGVVAFCFKEILFDIMLAPRTSDFITCRWLDAVCRMLGTDSPPAFSVSLINTGLAQQFMIHIKTAMCMGVLCASPYILCELFRFVSPGLYDRKRRYGVLMMGSGYVMFLLAPAFVSAHTAVPDSVNLGEAVVTGTRELSDVRHLPQTVTVVGRNTLTMAHRTNVLPTLTEQVPGLLSTGRGMMGYGVSTGGSGGMMLRGISSAGGQLMVLIDGHPQYNGIYGHSIADAYQTMMVERVEVLRGPASLLYGSNAMGGVVNIVTRTPLSEGGKAHIDLGAGSWGTFQGEVGYELYKKRLRLTVSGQYGRSDNHRPHMGFEQYGGFAKLRYDLRPHWSAFADADVTHFAASYPGTITSPMLEADQWITRGSVAIGVENRYRRTSGRLSVYDNFGRHKINDGYNALTGSPQTRLFRSRDALTGVSWYQSARLWQGSRLTVGADYQNIYGHAYYTDRRTGEVLATQNKQSGRHHSHEVAAYAELRQDLSSLFTVEAGLRYDHHSVTGGEWIPQAGLVVRPTAHGTLRLMASKGFRNPTMREMYLYPPSNTDLRPERMWNYELSWRHTLMGGRLQYGVNVFRLHADNIIQTINRQNVNTGTLTNTGAELDVQWRISEHWGVESNHSLLHMRHPVVSAPKYKGYLGATTRYGRFSARMGLTQVCGLYTAIGTDGQTENFTLLNATLGYAVCRPVRLWVSGENLLAQRYEYVAGMPMPRATVMAGVSVEL